MAHRRMFHFLGLLLLAYTANGLEQAPLSEEYVCTHPPYTVQTFSRFPLVVYISDFITPAERAHLQAVTAGSFYSSLVFSASGAQVQHEHRTSMSTAVPRDPVVRCIETRALLFQGLDTPRSNLEPLQLVQYTQNQTYHYHNDWFPKSTQTNSTYGGNRISSFFVYVAVEGVTDGGTNFASLSPPQGGLAGHEKWCEYIDCDHEWERGVTFKPIEGNAVFWLNLKEDGEGDDRLLHSGLPVTSGRKLGMNIWTREGPLSNLFRGQDVYDD